MSSSLHKWKPMYVRGRACDYEDVREGYGGSGGGGGLAGWHGLSGGYDRRRGDRDPVRGRDCLRER